MTSIKSISVVFVYEGTRGAVKPESEHLAMPELIVALEALERLGNLDRVQVWTRGREP